MTVEEMKIVKHIICESFSCDDCPINDVDCFDEIKDEDSPTILRIIPKAMEVVESPAIKKFLSGFIRAGVV